MNKLGMSKVKKASVAGGGGGRTRSRKNKQHQTVRKLGGLGKSHSKQVQGSMASSHDRTQHVMHMACIKVGWAEMEKSGQSWVFGEVEKTKHADRLGAVKKCDIVLHLERDEPRIILECLAAATGWMILLRNSDWERNRLKNYKWDDQPSWFGWMERFPRMWNFRC